MLITSTEFQKDIGKHFEIVEKGEDLIITVRGKQKYRITKIDKMSIIDKLAGKYSDIDNSKIETSKNERIKTKYGNID